MKIHISVSWVFALFLSLTLLVPVGSAAHVDHLIPVVPNPELTTGALCSESDPDFVEYRYPEQVPWCRRNVWSRDRRAVYRAYNIPQECQAGHHPYIIDHFIPLSLGGSNSHTNLWPEHHLVGKHWGEFEYELFLRLSDGEITQQEAIEAIIRAKTQLDLDLSSVRGCGRAENLAN